jgi:hypothetical protein
MKFVSLTLVVLAILAAESVSANEQTLCLGEATPPGAVIVGYTYENECHFGFLSNGPRNAKVVETNLSYDMVVCSSSPVPSGYSIESFETRSACAFGFLDNHDNAKRIVNH